MIHTSEQFIGRCNFDVFAYIKFVGPIDDITRSDKGVHRLDVEFVGDVAIRHYHRVVHLEDVAHEINLLVIGGILISEDISIG